MKSKIQFFLLLLFFISFKWSLISAQEVLDKANHRFSYEFVIKKDTIVNSTGTDLVILQVGSIISKCFSYQSAKFDSLYSTEEGWILLYKSFYNFAETYRSTGIIDRKSLISKNSRFIIYKNHPSGKMTVTDGINLDYYIYTDQLKAQEWQIVDSTKTVLDYTCQMAVSDFRGRRWIAWFAPDIAISDGPWKLGGLPGLIMEAYDDQKHYHFTLVGIEKVDNEPIVFSPVILSSGAHGRYQETTRLDFLRGSVRYHINQNAFMNAQLGRPTFDESAEGNARHYDLIERDYR